MVGNPEVVRVATVHGQIMSSGLKNTDNQEMASSSCGAVLRAVRILGWRLRCDRHHISQVAEL